MMGPVYPPVARLASAIRATFTVVIGAQKNDHIFRGDHQEERPDDQRENTEHNRLSDGLSGARCSQHRFTKCIERAGADVSVDDTDTTKGKLPKTRCRGPPALANAARHFGLDNGHSSCPRASLAGG